MYCDDDELFVAEEGDDHDCDLNFSDPDYSDSDDNFRELPKTTKKSPGILSLQDICLLSISKHLHEFNLAFSISENSEFRRNLQFLQKFHSPYLIKAATRHVRTLDESYFNFLLNEYIKEFEMNILYRCDWDTVFKRISEIGHGFQKVCFTFPGRIDSKRKIDFVNKIVRHLSNVKILNLTSICNDSTLEIIASSCPHLSELYVDNCLMTDKGLKALCQDNVDNGSHLSLKHLSLPGVSGVKEGIAYVLQNMPSLEVVVHHELPCILYNMHKDSMNNTSERKYNLTSLHLGANSLWEENPNITDILNLFTDVCPHIKELSLPLASQEHLDLCFRFQELESFNASDNVTANLDLDLNEFLKCKGGLLRRLQLERFSVSAAVLVRNCPKLEKLDLNNMKFQYSESGITLQPLNYLQELSLAYMSFSDALVRQSVIAILNSSQKIEKLTLLSCKFENNEEFVTKLSKFCENARLISLKLSFCDVDDAFLQSVILTCSTLKTLEVEGCDNITAEQISNLQEMTVALKTYTEIVFTDDYSEFNSIDSGDNIYDDFFEYDPDNYDNDLFCSDNLYYCGYDSDDDY